MSGSRCCDAADGIGLAVLRRTLASDLAFIEPDAADLVATGRRSRLYDLDPSLHCSVVGTCFGLGELRRLLVKLGRVTRGATDHEVHHDAVLLAGRRDQGGKLISKALDKKFGATIDRLAAVRDPEALGSRWDDAVARGDIPDAYWAVLTHPAATAALVRRVFGEVHMLSHLVGAANRADVRRLQLLERENEALVDRLERQQLHTAATQDAKDHRIRELEALLLRAERPGEAPEAAHAELIEALRRERLRRARLERRIETLEARLGAPEPEEEQVPPPVPASPVALPPVKPTMPALGGATLLLVGGRPAQVPAIARAVAQAGGSLLHHDGGTEMTLGQLPGLASRADRMVVALDCVSHAAADAARRLAREAGKPLLPLPGLSLTSLARALGDAAAA